MIPGGFPSQRTPMPFSRQGQGGIFHRNERRGLTDVGEEFFCPGRVRSKRADDIFRPRHSQLEYEMIIGGLHVMTNPGFSQSMDDLADGRWIAAAPDQLDALLALALIKGSPP